MSDVASWLRDLGLERYANAFAANEIDFRTLPELTEEDLKELGLPIGPRRLVIRALAALRTPPGGVIAERPSTEGHPGTPAQGIDSALPAKSAERRQVTIMFCDMVGSSALATQLDPEDQREVVWAFQSCCAGEIKQLGGLVAQYLGDGVLAYFGYPTAHEDDPERAVRAGLAIAPAIGALALAGRPKLQARVGIATGIVVVGDLVGEGVTQENAAIGETTNLAARLQTLADPNAVLICPETHRLLGRLFEYRELGARHLKGFAKPVQVRQVTGSSKVENRFEAKEGAISTLLGRDEELDLLMRRWDQATRGQGRVVLISGEPGIGKSRLTRGAEDLLKGEAHASVVYHCSPYHKDSALQPIIGQILRAASIEGEDDANTKLDKLEAWVVRSGGSVSQEVPLLATLLSVAGGARHPLPGITPQRLKERTLSLLLAQVRRLAAQLPVLIIFEDLHWADPTSLELLSLAVDQISSQRVLLLATARPEFTSPWPSHRHISTLQLSRLDRDEGGALIGGIARGRSLPPAVLDQILMHADGVPLFIEELTKTVLESGLLRETGDSLDLTGPLLPLAIPSTLHGSLLARLDRLASAKDVAQIGAVIGREFSYELIAATAGLPRKLLNAALDQLVDAELVYQRGVPPDATYQFKHALVQDTAYASLVRSRRQELHSRIADALREQFPGSANLEPEILARHYGEAGLPEQAVEYWQLAADIASKREAHREAISHCGRGLELVAFLKDPERKSQAELRLLIRLGNSSISAKGWGVPEVSRAFERARTLSIESGDDQSLHPVLVGLYYYHAFNADLRSAEKLAEETLARGEARQDRVLQVAGHKMLLDACYKLGKFEQAREHLERGISLSHAGSWDEYALEHIDDPGPYMLVYGGCVLWVLGYPRKARQSVADAIALARDREHRLSLAHTVYMAGHLAELKGAWHEVKRANEDTFALAMEFGFSGLQQQVGRRDQLVSVAMHHDPEQMQYKREHPQPGFARSLHDAVLADAYGQMGSPEEGLTLLESTLAWTDDTGSRFFDAEVHRVKARLLALTGRTREAETGYEKALSIARDQKARMWELRAASDLARLLRDQGQAKRAYEALAPIYAWFTEGFDEPDLVNARNLLDGLTA
jgi:class 3 adenylate cyclase/tetratricopeptide (TPR) repeat protein